MPFRSRLEIQPIDGAYYLLYLDDSLSQITDGWHLSEAEAKALLSGSFFPEDVVAWMKSLPYFYENDHAIYVHAGLPQRDGTYPHPSELDDKTVLLWIRTLEFFRDYRGKRVVEASLSADEQQKVDALLKQGAEEHRS